MSDERENPLRKLNLEESSPKLQISKDVIGADPEDKPISFNWKFWNQIEYFGLGTDVNTNWFVTLLDRLKDISNKKSSDWERDLKFRKKYRVHEIDFNKKNCPFKDKNDLFQRVLQVDDFEISEDIEVYQFQLSKARGRVVGFLDADYRFNILLLDPLHNMQPSKDYDYKLNPTKRLECEFEQIENKIGFISAKLQNPNYNYKEFKTDFTNVINDTFFDTKKRYIEVGDIFFKTVEEIVQFCNNSNHLDDALLNSVISFHDLVINKVKYIILNNKEDIPQNIFSEIEKVRKLPLKKIKIMGKNLDNVSKIIQDSFSEKPDLEVEVCRSTSVEEVRNSFSNQEDFDDDSLVILDIT